MMHTAIISPCETYRYELTRIWGASLPLLSVVMVNPSTADASKNDATIRKVIEFAKRNGYGGIIVVNLFAFRATDVNELKRATDPTGPLNAHHVFCALMRSQVTLVAWGASGKLPPSLRNQWRFVADMARAIGRPLYCLGRCNDGHPRHPVIGVPYETPFTLWSAPR